MTARITEYTECYVGFIDILGMKNHIIRMEPLPDNIARIADALRSVASVESTLVSSQPSQSDGTKKYWQTQIRTFSDNVLLFVPVESERLNDVISRIAILHDSLLASGFCIRGALTISGMYWDNNWGNPKVQDEKRTDCEGKRGDARLTFGPGLVEAYELEQSVAVYPRIIVSPSLMEHIIKRSDAPVCVGSETLRDRTYMTFTNVLTYSDISKYIRVDYDGVPFLDMMNWKVSRRVFVTSKSQSSVGSDIKVDISTEVDNIDHSRYMMDMRRGIEKILSHASEPRIRAKHIWLANYFNSSLLPTSDIQPITVSWNVTCEHEGVSHETV